MGYDKSATLIESGMVEVGERGACICVLETIERVVGTIYIAQRAGHAYAGCTVVVVGPCGFPGEGKVPELRALGSARPPQAHKPRRGTYRVALLVPSAAAPATVPYTCPARAWEHRSPRDPVLGYYCIVVDCILPGPYSSTPYR